MMECQVVVTTTMVMMMMLRASAYWRLILGLVSLRVVVIVSGVGLATVLQETR